MRNPKFCLSSGIIMVSAIIIVSAFVILQCNAKPNVVIIMVDDMGSFDASYRGSNQIPTPNIDALGYNGIFFDRFYTPAMCTPSRSSVLTGKDPHNLGMQTWVIQGDEAFGLGLNDKLMSNYFQDAGYKTHLVGKWHVGFFQKKYTPTYRGFDSFFGYYNGLIDYYNYTYVQPGIVDTIGYDFRRNTQVVHDVKPGKYATDLFTEETLKIIKNHDSSKKPLFLMLNHLAPHTGNDYDLMQAPASEIEKFNYIADPKRRVLAAMISKLDDSVGQVVEAIKRKGILDDTIILFYSDNGAPSEGLFANAGSNFPLKGQKDSPWEGATRNLGLIYSPLIKQKQRVFDGFFHTTDVLPTLASACGVKIGKVDGYDQWKSLVNGGKSPRHEVINGMDNIREFSSIISGGWKIVNGTSSFGFYDYYYGNITDVSLSSGSYAQLVLSSRAGKAISDFADRSEKLTSKKIQNMRNNLKISCNEENNPIIECEPMESPCLFNIIDDPCERKNLAAIYPATLKSLQQRLSEVVRVALPVRRTFISDPRSDPALHEGNWDWYGDNDNKM